MQRQNYQSKIYSIIVNDRIKYTCGKIQDHKISELQKNGKR